MLSVIESISSWFIETIQKLEILEIVKNVTISENKRLNIIITRAKNKN